METSKTIIQARKISFSYDSSPNLNNISFELKEGEILGIMGESGSGKTSLMKLIAGLLSPEKGELHFYGEKIKGPEETLVPGHEKIMLVNQEFDLMPFLSVEENILRKALLLSNSMQKRLLGHFKRRLKLGGVKDNRATDTSGGQKQRVALATALVSKPDVLLLDEPFSNLDYPLKQEIIRLLSTDWKSKAMMVATHEPADMLALASKILVLQKGKLVQKGTPEEIYHQPKNEYVARLLGPVNFLNPQQAAAFGIESDRPVMLRPGDFRIGETGLRAYVRDCHFVTTGYEVKLHCAHIDADILVYSRRKWSGEVGLQRRIED